MLHSIIIPHRNRSAHLQACLWSIRRSAEVTGVGGYEIIVRDSNLHATGTFNKSAALNHGIETSTGDYLTFLDADAIVGPRWLESVPYGEHITRVCYRVRYLVNGLIMMSLDKTPPPIPTMDDLAFPSYDGWPLAWEAYGSPDYSPQGGPIGRGVTAEEFDPDGPWQLEPTRGNPLIFGNSQFTIRRDVLGDLRFDETFVGRGFEDVEMIWRIYLADPRRYKGIIWTDADHAMFHLTHDYSDEWDNPQLLAANLAHYTKLRDGYREQSRAERMTP